MIPRGSRQPFPAGDGIPGVQEVRIGKFIQIVLDSDDPEAAGRQLEEMSDKLLANPVIEDFRIEIVAGE